MLFEKYPIIVRGGGDLGTGVVYRLHKAGFPVIVTELTHPLVVRRRVALATAVLEQTVQIEDLRGSVAKSVAEADEFIEDGIIPVLISPALDPLMHQLKNPLFAVVDARLAKRNIDSARDQAPLVIGLGPGFTAGLDCHAVVETKRGHTLGRVIWQGPALPNSGTPGIIAGKGAERVLRAPQGGQVIWDYDIGDRINKGEIVGAIDGLAVVAPFDGIIRGLIAPETMVSKGFKIGDVDARAGREACYTISDKALAVGGGVLEAVLTFLSAKKHKTNSCER